MADKQEKLITLIAALDFTNAALFTSSGKPKTETLKDLLGADVTAEERDLAWTEYQERAAEDSAAVVVDLTGAASVMTIIDGKAKLKWYRGSELVHVGPDPKAK
jgi:hypothetical protein